MHSLFVGVTLSGKTTLARHIARALRKREQSVIVYDPVGSPTAGGDWGEGAHVFSDEEQFLEVVNAPDVRHAHIFVDEADIIFGHSRPENFWMVTRGRHFGFSVALMSQRPALIDPTVRGQATRLYMFRLARADRVLLGQEKGFDNFAEYDLDAGDFIVADSAQRATTRLNVFQLLKRK